jgi:hypothetical protein
MKQQKSSSKERIVCFGCSLSFISKVFNKEKYVDALTLANVKEI